MLLDRQMTFLSERLMARTTSPTSTVRLARGGVFFLVAATLVLGASVYTQNNLLFWSFGLMIGGLVVAIVMVQFTLRGMSVKRDVPAHFVAGETEMLRYEVTNRRRLLPGFGIVIVEAWAAKARVGSDAELPGQLKSQPVSWLLHVGPGQTQHAVSPILPGHRGALAFRRVLLQTSFPFGIFMRTMAFAIDHDVLVYPPLYRINRQLLSRLTVTDYQGRTTGDKPGGTEDFYGLREYRPGDSLRTVDWKRSASRTAMVSREHEMPRSPKVNITLDLTAPTDANVKLHRADDDPLDLPESPVERAISLAASLICEAYLHGCEIGMTIKGVEGPSFRAHHSLPHRTQMLDALCRLDVNARSTMTSEPSRSRGGVSVVITTGAGGDERRDSAKVLSADDMADYVLAREGDVHRLLAAPAKRTGGKTPSMRKKVAG